MSVSLSSSFVKPPCFSPARTCSANSSQRPRLAVMASTNRRLVRSSRPGRPQISCQAIRVIIAWKSALKSVRLASDFSTQASPSTRRRLVRPAWKSASAAASMSWRGCRNRCSAAASAPGASIGGKWAEARETCRALASSARSLSPCPANGVEMLLAPVTTSTGTEISFKRPASAMSRIATPAPA